MSLNVQANSVTTGFLTANAGASFQGNLNVNNTCFVNNQNRNSSEAVKELVLLPSDQLMMRPYTENNLTFINETFAMCSSQWETVPAISIGVPVIDLIIYNIVAPIGNNTIGKILSDYVWRLRSNNTDDIYASNISPDSVPTNGLTKGLYLYIPDTVPTRHYAITRPLRCIKGSAGITGNGFSYELKFLLTSLTSGQKYSFGFTQLNASNGYTGNNLDSASDCFGFVLDFSQFSNYSMRAFVRTAGTTTHYNLFVTISANQLVTLRINWDYENPNCKFFCSNGVTSNSATCVTDFGANPATSIMFDPFINVYNSVATASGVILESWKLKYYTYTA